MTIKVGFLKSESQTLVKSFDRGSKEVNSYTINSEEIKKEPLNLLFFQGEETAQELGQFIKDEHKFYPILDSSSVGLNIDSFDSLGVEGLNNVFEKINHRWLLSKNIQTVESMFTTITYLKDLWINDRNAFFEELWFAIRTNLGTTQLRIIFNDLKMPTAAAKEKGEKPVLCQSFVQGEKVPQIFEGTDAEEKLMKEYKNEFNEGFNITEYNSDSGQLVFCANIEKSPILVMAELSSLNQLQRSILAGFFNGLQ